MKNIKIVHLYPKEMNIYGDNGNVQIIYKRLEWLGYKTTLVNIGVGENLPADSSIIIGGGGQDAGQSDIAKDLLAKQKSIKQLADNGVPMLMVCGLYQLFGHYFKTANSGKIPGIGVLDAYTVASPGRIIGNIVVQTKEWGDIIGYENHSGRTYLADEHLKIGTTKNLQGNNGEDLSEGCRYNNVFGTYLHGPVLSKNILLVNYFIEQIIGHKIEVYEQDKLKIVDKLAVRASAIAKNLQR
ncbi:glutamine amidotransferase [Candidatus Saccharibacteria bacterium]|jgi:CobQ-like glutamine amidotransferase family enzyme|nr:glutamine amidotransferase [Candidatus Saccharibacteria bacterium]MCA9350834.1 glutamine amidotransferase [Candidatus Saccharibacteria bacterium]